MTKQLLFYEHTVPLSAERHHDWSLAPRKGFEFASHTNSVPLAAIEFPQAAAEYAIVFIDSGGAVSPAAILGLKSDENAYLGKDGEWNAKYIPAFVRRYPFVFSQTKAGGKLLLCIDDQFSGWNQEGRGSRLFEANAERTKYLSRILRFMEDYQQQSARTQAFCKKLQALELLAPMSARFKLPSGDKAALTGFMAVDRDKLKALPGDKLAELAGTNELELIYIHLQSMRNFAAMVTRVSDTADGEAPAEPDFEMNEDILH